MSEQVTGDGARLRARLEDLPRYDLVTNYRCGSSIEEMECSDDGEWVRFEAVETALGDVLRIGGGARLEEIQEEDQTRVGPSVPCVETTGSTAEQQLGVVTAAERPEHWRSVLDPARPSWPGVLVVPEPFAVEVGWIEVEAGNPRNFMASKELADRVVAALNRPAGDAGAVRSPHRGAATGSRHH